MTTASTTDAGGADALLRWPAAGAAAVVVWLGGLGVVLVGGLLTARSGLDPQGLRASALNQALIVLAGLGAAAGVYALRARPPLAAHLVVAVTAVVSAGTLAFSLAKTPFGLGGLDADQSFRTASTTRFSLTAWPVDFGYHGHGSFMPPLWYWLAGRVADLLGAPGWEAMRWAQVLSAFLVPLVAFLLWRRVAGIVPAAVVVTLAVLGVPDPVKGDEWLALAAMLPWWLDAFGDVRAQGVRPLPSWLHGVIAGVLLSLYTAFFLPAAAATILLMVLAVRDGSWRPLVRRWLVLLAVGLAVWSWVWVPALVERLTGPPYELFQLFWFGDTSPVPAPVELTPVGVLVLLGLVAIAWWGRSEPLLARIAVFVAGTLAVLVVGLISAAVDHPILVQKTYPLLRYTLVGAAGIGGCLLVREWIRRQPRGRARVLRTAGVALLATTVTFALSYATETVRSSKLLTAAYTQPRPDGSLSGHGVADPPATSAAQIAAVLGDVTDQVVLSDRYDIFALYGYWNFQQFTPSYAHPHARYADRLALIEQLAATREPDTAWRLLRHNDLESVDALVLRRQGDRISWSYRRLDYPRGTVPTRIELHRSAFDDSRFVVTELPGWLVVQPTVRAAASGSGG